MIDLTTKRRLSATPARHRRTLTVLAGLLALAIIAPSSAAASSAETVPVTATPAIVTTSTSATAAAMADYLLSWLNRDRAASGLQPLVAWPTMANVANQRSVNMASSQVLSHTAAGGDPGRALSNAGIGWYSFGEIIGQTSYPWGTEAAANLYHMWMGSPLHHSIMFSASYNYVGIGIARSADGSTWSSILFSESADHTRPVAYNGALRVGGTSIGFRYAGRDPLLQSHTAGIRGYNVQMRVNYGGWTQVRTLTTATLLYLTGRRHRSTYSFRVQAVDGRGNLSAWTAPKSIYVP